MAIYGYCRVSTLKQANEGESLDVQRRQIEGYALMHGLTIAEVLVEEGVSGSVPVEERPVGGPLFAKLAAGRHRHRGETGSPVPLGPRRAQGRREPEGQGRQAPPARPGRRHRRQRDQQTVPDDRRSLRRGRARPHPRAHRTGEGRPEGAWPLPRRQAAVRVPARRRRRVDPERGRAGGHRGDGRSAGAGLVAEGHRGRDAGEGSQISHEGVARILRVGRAA